jgi:large subunit ribosomal protein L41
MWLVDTVTFSNPLGAAGPIFLHIRVTNNNCPTTFTTQHQRRQKFYRQKKMHISPSLFARSTTGIRRLRLTTKQVNGGYYKGTGTGTIGRHTKHGGFEVDWNKVRTYVAPDLKGFDVCISFYILIPPLALS